jgi:hypothetical protein
VVSGKERKDCRKIDRLSFVFTPEHKFLISLERKDVFCSAADETYTKTYSYHLPLLIYFEKS